MTAASAPITWANVQVAVGDLHPWADNPRLSTKAQARRMLESWQRFGQVQTIAIGPGGEVYDGHQRLSALLTLHGPSYRVDARQSDRALTDEERRALVVMLHAGAVGAWDWDALSGWDAEALQGWGMDAELLADWQTDIFALRTMIETTPDFEPVDESEQPRLDQKSPVTCPECGHEFIPG